MNAVRTIGLIAAVWVLLMGIAWLADSFPEAPPQHTSGSAADYADLPADDDGPGFTRGSAADYADPNASGTPAPQGQPIAPATPSPTTPNPATPNPATPNPATPNPATPSPATNYEGPWSESTQCDTLADASALRTRAPSMSKREVLVALAELRYPPGVPFIEALPEQGLNTFAPGTSFEELVSSFDTVVHEGSHMWGATRMRLTRRTLSIVPDDSRNLRVFQTFDRSRIVSELRGPEGDSYRQIYLEGESGAQGLETLLDETNAYVHSLASATCLRDLYPQNGARSSRDGILAMLYYLGEYLRMARIEEPELYQRIRGNENYVRFIVDQWERAHYWLAKSASASHLGILDDAFSERVHASRVQSEFEMFRRAATASP